MFVLAYDLGGTKVAAGIVNDRGKVLSEIRTPIASAQGKAAVLRQLSDIGWQLIREFPTPRQIRRVGIASAGPLHAAQGVLLDPTNLAGPGKSWGKVPLVSILRKKLKRPVYLENDAAAAILAEHWVGSARRFQDAMILTLGTGLGTGMIANGKLVRAGQGLHTEAGHLILNENDTTAPCGCGNFGCAEAYLSGKNFTHRTRPRLKNPNLKAEDIAALARSGNSIAKQAFHEYALHMATALHNYVVLYAPEVVILTGSFAAASDLFLKQTQAHLESLLKRRRRGIDMMPKIIISRLQNQAGLIGGAYIAFNA